MRAVLKRKILPDRPTMADKQAYRRLLKAGYTKMQLARICKITKQAVTRWEAIPLKYVRGIHEATGIAKADLRPSDFT